MKLLISIVLLVLVILLALYFLKPRRKETYFNRDLQYGRANSVLWDRYLAKGIKGITKEDDDIRNTYKYLGTGNYTGMLCREPNNIRCTTYNIVDY